MNGDGILKLITTRYMNGKKDLILNVIRPESRGENYVVNVYPQFEYQTIMGFGGAITEAAGYVFSRLGEENRKKVLDLYFSKRGNRYSMTRTHIDSCDFSLDMYEAMSNPEDPELESFSLERDDRYIIPMIKAAQETMGEPIDIMLSPWSPPAFMKTNRDRKNGGQLKPKYYSLWAKYIARYIKEYEKRGLNVSRITIQNEPMATQVWDSCLFSAEEEKTFLRDHLYPTLVEQGLSNVKINIWDHNKERLVNRACAVIDNDTDKMIDGIAFHWYTGDHFEAVNIVRELFPGKQLIFSEGCVEYSRFGDNQLRNAQMYAHDIIGNLNAGMTGFIDWNILLDDRGGPNHVKNYCEAPIMADVSRDELYVKLSYDYIGHFSRYIKKGAKRIGFSKYTKDLDVTAVKNPDGSIVLVFLNATEKAIPVHVHLRKDAYVFEMLSNAISTAIIESGEY